MLRGGVVTAVRANDGDSVTRGAPLFVVRSSALSDRSADRLSFESQKRGSEARLAILEGQYRIRRRADSADERRLLARIAYLERQITSKTRRLGLLREIADSSAAGASRGSIGRFEASRLEFDARSLAEEVEGSEQELAEVRADVSRLESDRRQRDLDHQEARRALEETIETAGIRAGSLQSDLANITDSGLVLNAPCTGTLIRLRVKSPGAVVPEGAILGEVACRGELLQGELEVPESGLPFIQPGQAVKLRFDAFPYQRYGVRFGTVRWLGPAGIDVGEDSSAFRALVVLRDSAIRVRGQLRPLLAGMSGQADIVVGRRSLASYAFEPIRALKESLAEVPAP
jgi:membrane fusion protein